MCLKCITMTIARDWHVQICCFYCRNLFFVVQNAAHESWEQVRSRVSWIGMSAVHAREHCTSIPLNHLQLMCRHIIHACRILECAPTWAISRRELARLTRLLVRLSISGSQAGLRGQWSSGCRSFTEVHCVQKVCEHHPHALNCLCMQLCLHHRMQTYSCLRAMAWAALSHSGGDLGRVCSQNIALSSHAYCMFTMWLTLTDSCCSLTRTWMHRMPSRQGWCRLRFIQWSGGLFNEGIRVDHLNAAEAIFLPWFVLNWATRFISLHAACYT